MAAIEQLIGDILLRNNCVIIPSFGGFVAKQISARIDFNSGKMYPPSKSLLFNKQLVNNDGLLINEFSLSNGISFDEASKNIKTKVATWKKTLNSGGRIELDKVGFLYADSENNLCFEQDRFYNLLLESFGLGQIHFVSEQETKVGAINPLTEEKVAAFIPKIDAQTTKKTREPKEPITVIHPELTRRRSNTWKYIAAACILPIAFYSIWIPMKTDVLESGLLSTTDFNPFHKTESAAYSRQEGLNNLTLSLSQEKKLNEKIEALPSDITVYPYKYDDGLFIPVKIRSAATTDKVVSDKAVVKEVNAETPEININAMHFIVGCFGDLSNANSMVEKLKTEGMDARIVDVKNGLHRVSAGSAISLEAFQQLKSSAKALGYVGWTLK